jgi:hypothetical protein
MLGLGDAFIEFRDLFRREASETSVLFPSFGKLFDQFAPLGRRERLEQFEDAFSGFGHGPENSIKGASCEAVKLCRSRTTTRRRDAASMASTQLLMLSSAVIAAFKPLRTRTKLRVSRYLSLVKIRTRAML